MSRFVYVNGQYQRYRDATTHVEDRGYQFSDAVYEVVEVRNGRLIDAERHFERLWWSLAQLDIRVPRSQPALAQIIKRVVRLNRVRFGLVYLQVSRGVAKRDFIIPVEPLQPSLVVLARSSDPAALAKRFEQGISVVTRSDPRWARCDIKTVMLLPASLAKTEAADRDAAQEVWFLEDDGTVIEGGSSTAWIVDRAGILKTRPLSRKLLPGVTRATTLDVARDLEVEMIEAAFSRKEALNAREAFITAASAIILPVVSIDGHQVGDGQPGPITRRLRDKFHQVAETCGRQPLGLGSKF